MCVGSFRSHEMGMRRWSPLRFQSVRLAVPVSGPANCAGLTGITCKGCTSVVSLAVQAQQGARGGAPRSALSGGCTLIWTARFRSEDCGLGSCLVSFERCRASLAWGRGSPAARTKKGAFLRPLCKTRRGKRPAGLPDHSAANDASSDSTIGMGG